MSGCTSGATQSLSAHFLHNIEDTGQFLRRRGPSGIAQERLEYRGLIRFAQSVDHFAQNENPFGDLLLSLAGNRNRWTAAADTSAKVWFAT
jgi:hypothetical protein